MICNLKRNKFIPMSTYNTLLSKDTVQKERRNCIKKFLYYFPKGFKDAKYIDWERGYKWQAHLTWEEELNKEAYEKLLAKKRYTEICQMAIKIESKTNLLFSFEKMALRDGVKTAEGAKAFAIGLYDYIYGAGIFKERFQAFTVMLASLPRKQTRVLTWPVQTVSDLSPGLQILFM
jgi:hypothetical protein